MLRHTFQCPVLKNFFDKRSYKIPIINKNMQRVVVVWLPATLFSFFLTLKQGNVIQGLPVNWETCSNAYLPLAVSCGIRVPTHSTIRPCASMSLFKSRQNQGLMKREKKSGNELSGRNGMRE